MHLANIVLNGASKFGHYTAFQIKRDGIYKKWSYSRVKESVSALMHHLSKKGIKKGDRVAIMGENSPEWAIAYLAVTSMCAVAVPIDIMLKRDEIIPLLNDCKASMIITSARAREEAGNILGNEVKMEDFDGLEAPETDPFDGTQCGEDDLAVIVYTSGTTGRSKGVMLTHTNIISNVQAVTKLFSIEPGDNFLSVLPMHHTFETTCGLLSPLYLGAEVTYAESLKSHNLLANMQETKVTVMCGVPLLYKLFYDGIMREVEEKGAAAKVVFLGLMGIAGRIAFQSVRRKLFSMIHKKLGGAIRFWVSGGAAIDPEILKAFDLFGITVVQGYGLSESAPILSCNTLDANRIGSVGRAVPGVEIKISESGEILARGQNIMKGYYHRPDLTAEVIKDGWLYTGDIGKIDKDGFVYITGRIKDVIVTGSGVNVYPDELEFKIAKIKGIKDVCVIGAKVKTGARAGSEEVWSVVQPNLEYFSGQGITDLSEIKRILKENIFALNEELAEYKRIAEVHLRSNDFPKTTTRKVKKFEVKKELGLI